MTRPAGVWRLWLTCEHGGCTVPAPYRPLFQGWERRLRSHRGYDRGSLWLAKRLARATSAPLIAATVTRLVVDLNRSLTHPRLFSPVTAALPADARAQLLERHYHPYRGRVESGIAGGLARGGRVLHVAVHTFTPVLRGTRRRADVGLLYDPARPAERAFAVAWRQALREEGYQGCVCMNAPYRGAADGLPTALRRRFPAGTYAGIELEVNQRDVHQDRVAAPLAAALTRALVRVLNGACVA